MESRRKIQVRKIVELRGWRERRRIQGLLYHDQSWLADTLRTVLTVYIHRYLKLKAQL